MSREHAPLLPHHSIVLRRGPIGWCNDGTVTVAGDVVRPHELTARDAEVGGHGRGWDKILGTIEGAQAGAAVHASVWHVTVSVGKVHCTAIQAAL